MEDSPLPELLDPLTSREQDVLRMMLAGLANRQIASELVIEVDTVRWYTKQIYNKLGVHSRTEAVLRAQELGLMMVEEPSTTPTAPIAPIFHNMPTYHTLFIGRDQELSDLSELLKNKQTRLVTIAGPGGIGKTRLAVEVAHACLATFPEGIYFVPLASVQKAEEVETAVARAMGLYLTATDNVRDRLQAYLQNKQVLLVMDNFEHLEGSAHLQWIAQILTTTQAVKILATSRTSLNVGAEWVRHLAGIDFPQGLDGESVAEYSAIQLFVDRVHRIRHDFSLAEEAGNIIEICRLVQGMPLALELAAAWVKALPCAQIVREIKRNVDFLATTFEDVDPRHRSLRAVFDTSWQMLKPQEQQVMQRLSVFRGGFGLAAAEQVADASPLILAQLIDKSLLYHQAEGKYEMHELLRHYVKDRFDHMPLDELSTRSGKLLAWSKLIQGEFEGAAIVARDIIERKSGQNVVQEAFGLALSGVLSGMDGDYERCQQLCTAALAQTQSVSRSKDPVTLFFVNLGLAVADYSLEDYLDSTRHIQAALRLATNLYSPAFLTLCLPVTAVILAYENQTTRAVELLGLASARPTETPTWMENWPLLQQTCQDIETMLGPDEYRALWERGKALDLRETVNALLLTR